MLPKIQKRKNTGGFLGAAKKSSKAIYREIDKTPEMYSYGEESCFITPKDKEKRKKAPKGIKR